MELIKADVLTADALEIGDLISFDDDIVEVISIDVDSTGDIYSVQVSNDFGETTTVDLLSKYEFHIMPIVNPDGYEYTFNTVSA